MFLNIAIYVGLFVVAAGGTFALTMLYCRQKKQHASKHFQNFFHEAEESRGLFIAAFHAGSEGRVAVSLGGRILAVNRAVGELFNLPEKDYINKNAGDLWTRLSKECERFDVVDKFFTSTGPITSTGPGKNTSTGPGKNPSTGPGKKKVELKTRSGIYLRIECTDVFNVMRKQVAKLFLFTDITEEKSGGTIKDGFIMNIVDKLCDFMRESSKSLDEIVNELGDDSSSPSRQEKIQKLKKDMDNLVSLSYALQISRLNLLKNVKKGHASVKSIINELSNEWAEKAKRKGLGFSVEMDENLSFVPCLPDLLREGINRIVENSLKFTGNGGVNLKIGRAGDGLWIMLEDSGPCISKEEKEQVFDPYFRISCEPGNRAVGMRGIELALAREILESCGGTFKLENRKEKRNKFCISLPVDKECVTGEPEPELQSESVA